MEPTALSNTKDAVEVSALRADVGGVTTVKKIKKNASQQFIERNAARVKDLSRKVPNTLIVVAELKGESVRII